MVVVVVAVVVGDTVVVVVLVVVVVVVLVVVVAGAVETGVVGTAAGSSPVQAAVIRANATMATRKRRRSPTAVSVNAL